VWGLGGGGGVGESVVFSFWLLVVSCWTGSAVAFLHSSFLILHSSFSIRHSSLRSSRIVRKPKCGTRDEEGRVGATALFCLRIGRIQRCGSSAMRRTRRSPRSCPPWILNQSRRISSSAATRSSGVTAAQNSRSARASSSNESSFRTHSFTLRHRSHPG